MNDSQVVQAVLDGVLVLNGESSGIGKRWTKGAMNHGTCDAKPKMGSAEAAANRRNSHLTIRGGL